MAMLLDALINERVLERVLEWPLLVLGPVDLMLDELLDRLLEAPVEWLLLCGDVDRALVEGPPELERELLVDGARVETLMAELETEALLDEDETLVDEVEDKTLLAEDDVGSTEVEEKVLLAEVT
ncbi:hypothetical protein IMSHALPRED_009323 [Imshaugia aleurites]|uniref:Uncharacterized protein n=1 Tax=Imshaugia aleurites TaxID=172621 RepID=A0A8H3G5F3_9LECA|nr:hypothetical protein IMSHALPRED_009323 [Imshaugia aleurites]